MTEPTAIVTRKSKVKSAVQRIFEELAGSKLEGAAATTFLEFGLDSLFLTQAAEIIEQQFGTPIHFAQLLDEQSTFESLGAWIDKQLAPGAFAQAPANPAPVAVSLMLARGIHIQDGFSCLLTTAHTEEDLDGVEPAAASNEVVEAPLTEAQIEIRLSAQLGADESCAYNEGFNVRFAGVLDERALRDAFHTVTARHEALRATLSESGDMLICHPRLRIELPLVDLSGHDAAEKERTIAQMKADDARSPFDLIRGPLVRARLVRLSEQEHLLFITAHHIICDRWSSNVLLSELAASYTANCEGRPSELPEPLRFSSYAWTEKQLHRVRGAEKVESYWAKVFEKPAPLLDLPTDRPRPSLKSCHGHTCLAKIDRATCDRIRKAGAQKGSTLFCTLLTGFNILLARLARQKDIVVGIPAAAQSRLPDGPLVGHCVNFLPVRLSLEGAPSAADMLGQCRRKLIEANGHHSYTYGTLVRKLALPRDPGRLPLIEVQFSLEKAGDDLPFRGIEFRVEQNARGFVNFDLSLNITESRDGLTLYCDYNTGLFDESTIARWLSHYRVLLEAMAEKPGMPVSRLPMLTAAGRNRLIEEWNATAAEYDRDACIHQLFETQARRVPQAIAVTFGAESLTYDELNRRADALAAELQSSGLGPDGLAAICIEPSIDMLLAVLAVMKAGGAYVPLDPSYPSDRIQFIIEDAAAGVLLTTRSASAHLNTGRARVCYIDELHPSSGAAPRLTAKADDRAYVIYTSGSTGKPKGVEVTHRNVVNFLASMQRVPGLNESDSLLAVTTLSFDIAGLELLLPLSVGARVVIAARDTTRDGRQLARLIEGEGITAMQATPSTWRLLLDADWAGHKGMRLMCGGEELPRELANALALRSESLWNMYGPTETTIWSSVLRIDAGSGPVPVGQPIANTQFYVLDPNRQIVPIGVPGELYIAGEGVARGYLNRPELTREKFVANPFVNDASARMYRTGDRVRYRPDGLLEFLGRLDDQVKIRGHRVELGEIETLLETHPALKDSAVVAREDEPQRKRLVGYVVRSSRARALDTAELERFLTSRLPDYMVPSVFVTLDAMPLTPNGKTDRRALLALPAPGRAAAAVQASPRKRR